MWTDEKNALDHLEDLKRVRARIEKEELQGQEAGQISTTPQMQEYRLKVIDSLIKQSEFESKGKKEKDKEDFYR